MTNKQIYSQFCQQSSDIPLFMQPWWMDAVCAGKQWDVLLQTDEKDEVCAAVPYLLRSRMRMRYIIMPKMTQIGGVWLRSDVLLDTDWMMRISHALDEQLRSMNVAYYYQHYPLHSPIPQWMQQLGYEVKRRVTYRIEDLSDLDRVIDAFSKNKKRQLQKALSLHADRHLDVEDFYRFHVECLGGRGRHISYTREFLLVLERKTSRYQQSQIMAIRNADDELLAAAFLVWDKHSMYYLIPCYSEQYKDSGASALLVLESIKLAREIGVAFDFEGSMIKGVANHYRQFGSKPTEYYSVEKYYHWWFRLATLWNRLRERKLR